VPWIFCSVFCGKLDFTPILRRKETEVLLFGWWMDTESDNNNRWPFSAHRAAELIKLARCCISGCSRRLAAVCCRGALSATFGSRHAGIVCVQRAPGSDSPLCEENDRRCRWRVSVGVEQGKAFRVQAPPVSVPFCWYARRRIG
jgi:hypothetical protein